MPTHNLSALLALSSIVAVAGCSAPPPVEAEGGGSSKIIGGKADAGDSSIVAVVAYTDGGKTYATCTGEVIAPRVVLTASHCVSPIALGFVPEGVQIMTSQDISTATAADVVTGRGVTHPGYDANTGMNDIAVVLLDEAVNLPAVPYSRVALEGNDGKSARIIGYGTTKDGDSTTAGKKNEATVKISAINDHDFVASALPVTQCHGDSGGPVLLNVGGKETIIGIGWVTVRNDGLCSEGVKNTRVDKFLSFIDPFVVAGGGAPGADGAGDPTPGGQSESSCCRNGQFYDCPSVTACFTDVAQCTRAPAKDAKCNGG
jgi:secreted trypsin-like serine protease